MMRTKPILWTAALAIALTSTATLANVVVVKSLGPSSKAYPPGKMLPESAKITLQGGDVVTLIGPGSARTLRGPGNFDTGQVTIESAAAQRGRFGALRTGNVVMSPSIWDVDVSQSGKFCVADAKKLQLWRPNSGDAASIVIRSSDGQAQALNWAAGKAIAPWPEALPLTTGAHYDLDPGTGDKGSVDVVAVSSVPNDQVGTAQLLVQNGCQNQLDLLVSRASDK